LTTSPTATLYCLPPVLTIAYVAFSAAIGSFFFSSQGARYWKLRMSGFPGLRLSPAAAWRQLLKIT
jgi:hypothetical protein